MEFNSWFNVKTVKMIPCDRPQNRFGLHCHPLTCLMVETRPTLLEDHRYVLRLVQGNPRLWWISGKPDLFQTMFAVPSAIGNHFSKTVGWYRVVKDDSILLLSASLPISLLISLCLLSLSLSFSLILSHSLLLLNLHTRTTADSTTGTKQGTSSIAIKNKKHATNVRSEVIKMLPAPDKEMAHVPPAEKVAEQSTDASCKATDIPYEHLPSGKEMYGWTLWCLKCQSHAVWMETKKRNTREQSWWLPTYHWLPLGVATPLSSCALSLCWTTLQTHLERK